MKSVLILLVIAFITCLSDAALTKALTHGEQQKLLKVLNQDHKDLDSIYYSVTALAALGKSVSNADALCQNALNLVNQDNAESVFQFSEIVKSLKCKSVPALNVAKLLTEESDITTVSYIVGAMANFGNPVSADILEKFVAVVKDTETPASAAKAFYAASLLPKSDELKPVVSMVEDILAQADEVGGVLQFEGGLAVTSAVVRGALLLGEKTGSQLVKQGQITKFAQYFVNRKFVFHLKDIHHLLLALGTLSNNQLQVPVVVSVHGSNQITNENNILKVRVTNLLDQSIPDVKVSIESFTTADESVTLFANKPFTKTPEKDDFITQDNEVARGYIAAHSFSYNIMSASPSKGMYKCNVDVQLPKGAQKYVTSKVYDVSVKVLARIMVEDVEIAVGDKDHALSKTTLVTYPNKFPSTIEADYHQKLVMTFNLKDVFSKQLTTAHQTFVRLVHVKSGQEIFFVAEADDSDHYKFTLDVSATAKDSFNNLSGEYKMSLIIGDATMQVPINWVLGDIVLTFAGEPKKSKRQERVTDPKPVIEHMFRVPEVRPAKIVSTAFTILVLSPLVVMFGMWVKIGANLSNFHFSLSTLVFHVGLCGIFGLYYFFWIKLNMFETLKLLAVVGGLTFLGGNKMLTDIAAQKYRN